MSTNWYILFLLYYYLFCGNIQFSGNQIQSGSANVALYSQVIMGLGSDVGYHNNQTLHRGLPFSSYILLKLASGQ